MKITLSPMRSDTPLTVARDGDTLTINGETFDFSEVAEGATLSREDAGCQWLAGDVRREDGVLHMTLILPHGPNAPQETRFPAPITVEDDGPIEIPPYDEAQEDAGA